MDAAAGRPIIEQLPILASMSTASLFQRFVQDELGRAPALVQKAFVGTVQLLGQSGGAVHAIDQGQHGDIARSLQRDAALFQETFVESLERRGGRRDRRRARCADRRCDPGAGGLELMDESRVEADIEISRAAQLIDSTAEWELRELQTFTSTLTGQAHVSSETNPFRPLVYAAALWDAACAVVGSPAQRAIILRTSAGVAAGLLKNAWAAASTRLESAGVEPGVYRTLVLPSGGTFGRFQAPETPKTHAMSSLLASMPGSMQGAGEQPATARRAASEAAVPPRRAAARSWSRRSCGSTSCCAICRRRRRWRAAGRRAR